jgi:hypothetical protein
VSPFDPTPEVDDAGHYFTVAELRASARELVSTEIYPDADLEVKRDEAEEDFEELAHRAFVERTHESDCYGGEEYVFLPFRDIRAITSVTDEDGVAVDTTGVVIDRIVGGLKHPSEWPDGILHVTFTHGKTVIPAGVKRAVKLLAKIYALPFAIDPRATAVINADAGGYRISVADKETGRCGIPDVDAAAARYGDHVPRVG